MYAKEITCTAAEYHADLSRLSRSMLMTFINEPWLYYRQYVKRDYEHEWSSAAETAMDIGTAVHSVILDGLGLDDVVRVYPDDVLSKSGARGTNACKAWEAENAGKILVKKNDYRGIKSMYDAIFEHPEARKLLDQYEGHNEYTLQFDDGVFPMERRVRADRWLPNHNIIVDIKTTYTSAKPYDFSRQARDSLDLQDAFYCDGFEALTGERPRFIFIVVSKETHIVRTFELDPQWRQEARENNEWAMHRLAECMESGEWRSPDEKGIVTISSPYQSKLRTWEAVT